MMNCVKQRNFYVKLFETCQGRVTSAHNLITARPNFWFCSNSFLHEFQYLYFLSAPAPWPYLASQIRVIMRQHCPALPCIAPTMSHPLALGSNNSLQSELSDPLLSSIMHCSTPISQNHIKQFCWSSWEFDLEKIMSISVMILLLANLQIKSF